MAVKPVDVRRKEFKNGFRGYDANQVDDFLDEVADDFERAYAENQRMKDELANLRGRLEQFEELEGAIREALVHAQQVARDLRRNANKEAELVVREAKEQAHRILADSSSRVERVQGSYEALTKAKQDFANDFRHLLKSYLAVMDNADVASAKEIEASLRERLDTESIAAARQAAETRRIEATQEEDRDDTRRIEPAEETGVKESNSRVDAADGDATGEVGGETQPLQTVRIPSDAAGQETSVIGAEPEVEEPEVETSSSQDTTSREAAPAASGAADEVDREEPMPGGDDGRAYDEFFDEQETRSGEKKAEESRVFRASRFLRRRG